MRSRYSSALRLALVLASVGLVPSSSDAARSARLRRMVVVGDSLLAGFSSGGFVGVGRAGQVDSAPAFIARRAHVKLPQPLMERPGLPPQLVITDDNKNGQLDAREVRRTATDIGFRQDVDKDARNLAVPGEDTESVFERIDPGDIASQLVSGNLSGPDVLKFLIIDPSGDGGSQVSRARELAPSFILVWLGNNEVLGMATRTNPDANDIGPVDFGNRFRSLLDALADTGAGMAVANLPDPTGIAALRRAGTDVTSCSLPGGGVAPVAADDLLSVDMNPALLPTPPCTKVLDAAERATIKAKIINFNAELAGAIADIEQRRGVQIALVDMFSRFEALRASGLDLNGDGTPDLTTRYLGGVFSLDGIHPCKTGNALVANEFIDAINARFGEAIKPINVARAARRDRLAHSRFRPAGEPPFGLFGEDEAADDVENFFDKAFDRITDGIDDIRDELEDVLDIVF